MYELDLSREQRVIDRLLSGPALIRYHTLLDLLDRNEADPEVRRARKTAQESKDIQSLLNNRRKNGKLARPEWWGPGSDAYKGLRLQPWVFGILAEAGLSRADEELRKAAQVCLELQNPDGSFGTLTGIDRVRFTAEVTYALANVGYARTGDIRNALRWLMLWLKENWPVRFDLDSPGPGRILLEALAHFEVFTVSPLAEKVLKALFTGKRTVLTASLKPEGVRMGGYDGLLTWSELGFAIGWPRNWDTPHQVLALLNASRNRDGMWGAAGSDFAETLRALKLWRDLNRTYGPTPSTFRFEPPQLPHAQAAQSKTRTPRQAAAKAPDKPAKDLSTRRRHMRAFRRAGLHELVNDVVTLFDAIGYKPDWRPMYEVAFRLEGNPCSFKMRLEPAPGNKDRHVLGILASGVDRKVNVGHWARQLNLERTGGKSRLQVSRPTTDKPGQVRLLLDNAQRKVLSRLKTLLTQLCAAGAGPTPSTRSRRSRRRRPRGRKR